MITFVKNWIKLKRLKFRLMMAFCQKAADFLDEKEDMIALAARLYLALKDTPTEELQEKLISQLAFLAHEEAVKEHG